MSEIKIIGKQSVGDVTFTGIEGGFGEGKRALLVKEIAEIHGKQVGHINEAINNNRKRFINGIDIIDLKGTKFVIGLIDNDIMTQNSVNRVSNIYALSERGYAKLLKILEDDKAWELYDQLVDGYFQMREQLNTSQLSPELQMVNGIFQSLAKQELATRKLEGKVESICEVVALNTTDWRKDARNLINKIAQERGGFEAYKEVHNEIYKEVERRGGYQLDIRLTNKRRRLADEGASKSKRDKLSKVDVIADDKRLVEIYVAVVKEFAIKYGVRHGDR